MKLDLILLLDVDDFLSLYSISDLRIFASWQFGTRMGIYICFVQTLVMVTSISECRDCTKQKADHNAKGYSEGFFILVASF